MAQMASRTFIPRNGKIPNIFTPTKFDLYTPMTYSYFMEFIETPIFTRLVLELLPDDEYRELQFMLADNPSCGDIIQGGGGIRKVRFSAKGKGKSGGVRVIYYWMTARGQIYMLLIYPKNKKDTLTDKETSILWELVKELAHG